MAAGFKPGDKAYIVESNRIVRQCTVIRVNAGMYLIRFENGGGIQVKAHRLFASQEEAEHSVTIMKKAATKPTGFRSPYDYVH
jgi:hypothetical protein